MRTKTVLIVSLTANVVLMGTLAYVQSLSIDPLRTPAVIFFVERSNPDAVSEAFRASGLIGDSAR